MLKKSNSDQNAKIRIDLAAKFNNTEQAYAWWMMLDIKDEMVRIEQGVSEDDQEGSFMNATLQNAGDLISMSIATTLAVPENIATEGQDAVAKYVKETLSIAASTSSCLQFHVQVGPSRAATNESMNESTTDKADDIDQPERESIFTIKWLYGYGESNSKWGTHPRSWFCADNGFEGEDNTEKMNALLIGESMSTGGPFDEVEITRIS